MSENVCTCPELYAGLNGTRTAAWDRDCPAHGADSPWWTSSEQQDAREARSDRLREIWEQARQARKDATCAEPQ